MMTLIYAGGAAYLPVLLCESLEGAEYGRVVGDDEVGLLLHALLQHVLRQVVRQHHPRHCEDTELLITRQYINYDLVNIYTCFALC